MIPVQPVPARTPMVGPDGYITPPWSAFFERFYLQQQNAFPAGMITEYAGIVAPDGWAFCDGSALSASDYPVLFNAIGIKYGGSDGQFLLPDKRGKFARGANTPSSVGNTGGANEATIEAENLPLIEELPVTDPGHNHVFEGVPHTHGVNDPGHTHTLPNAVTSAAGSSASDSGAAYAVAASTGSTATGIVIQPATAGGNISIEETGISVKLPGEGKPIATVPEYIETNYIIKL